MLRDAQRGRPTSADYDEPLRAGAGCAGAPHGRARPQDHRGVAGERARVVPRDRGARRRVGGHRSCALRKADGGGDPPGRGRDQPARARLRAGARRRQDLWLAGAGGRRDRALARGRLCRRHGRAVRPRRRTGRCRPTSSARADEPAACAAGRRLDGDLRLPGDVEAALRLGERNAKGGNHEMSITQGATAADELRRLANDHLWLHFTTMHGHEPPIIVRGDGCYLEDVHGKRYLDALAGLFSVNLGYGYGEEIGQAALEQMRELPFYTNWTYAHPRAIELAAEVAALAPGDLNRVFFCSGGSEAVESAWKLARQYFAVREGATQRPGVEPGEMVGRQVGGPAPGHKYKAIARNIAYHGTTFGALSINGVEALRTPFEPLVPEVRHVSNTNRYHRPLEETEEEFTAFLLEELERTILEMDPDTVCLVHMEPIQNAGGSFVAPAGYWRGVRELCDKYDILLSADEVITGFGRVGHWFASERYDIRPDIVTCAKGLSSSYAAIGAVVATDRVMEPFLSASTMYTHGITFGGHPVMSAIALKNIEIMKRERIMEHVLGNEASLRATLEQLFDLPIVGDVRGAGYFYALELVKDKETRETFSDEECETLLRGFLSPRLFEKGLICRADDRGDPVVQISPPLVANQAEFDEMTGILGDVLAEAWEKAH